MNQGMISISRLTTLFFRNRRFWAKLSGLSMIFALSAHCQAEGFAPDPMTLREFSLLAGAFVALMTFMSGQVLIPLYKYQREQKRGKELILTIMKVMADKTLDFFGDNTSTSIFDKVSYQIEQQIERAAKDESYIAHVSVSNEDIIRTKLMDEEHFWLVEEEVLRAFIKFEENASRARFMCRSVMDKEYLELVKHDRKRYVAALEQVKKQFDAWLVSTRELKEVLKDH
ncbi:hypothetical protein BTA51_15010 [Hahella sp. CCB-MM4]|uniref:hypothetical protein n=1 Tax=Hahella sp. (strain CCB-MM4) TaxID=1926491 RepID=UPI000B9C3EA8|nr:hypothetical protein [Hahella sp. CCB-MM4]OZG72436.1 hypothetical protein BTA51_15010 [Hahella sp. CCB-MM4]